MSQKKPSCITSKIRGSGKAQHISRTTISVMIQSVMWFIIEQGYQSAITETLEKDADNRVSDIHIWKIGTNHYAAIIASVTHFPKNTQYYKDLLNSFHKLSHVTIEVNACEGEPCAVPNTNNT